MGIAGDTVVVGAPYHTPGGKPNTGHAYVYVRQGTAWSERAILAASDGAAEDFLGWSVAISGDMVVVGAPWHDTGGKVDAGQAYVYVPVLFDYSLSNSGDITVAKGASGSNTITATLTEGSTLSVSFSAAGLPSGATAAFTPGACTPTCTSLLTISTASSTPTGTFQITVTATPLNKTTTFNLVVHCPATAALEGTPDREAKLHLLRDFRNNVLAATPTGRRYITTFYTHAVEGVCLMLRYPELRTRTRLQIERFFPTLQALAAGRSARLTSGDLADIDALLAAFAAKGSAGLQADLRALQQDLRQPTALRKLGIEIKDR